jgi:hypothetical protein
MYNYFLIMDAMPVVNSCHCISSIITAFLKETNTLQTANTSSLQYLEKET